MMINYNQVVLDYANRVGNEIYVDINVNHQNQFHLFHVLTIQLNRIYMSIKPTSLTCNSVQEGFIEIFLHMYYIL